MKDHDMLLEIENLCVSYSEKEKALKDFSLQLHKGESIGVIGESGSGKTTLAMSILDLLSNIAKTEGEIKFRGNSLLNLKEEVLNNIRWNKISMVFQNDLNTLNPVLTIKNQFDEVFKRHKKEYNPKEVTSIIKDTLEKVDLSCDMLEMYPHQLSGGMRQKVLIAMAVLCNPEIIIFDEPTSSLDELSKLEIEKLILELREEGYSMIVISHDFSFIKKVTSRLMILHCGNVVEEGFTEDVLAYPCHNYTRGLLNSALELNPYQDLWGIRGCYENTEATGCSFYSRCNQRSENCNKEIPKLVSVEDNRKIRCHRGGIVTLLKVENICKTYTSGGIKIKACNNCSLTLRSGEIIALIGKSGSGKTTLASIICGILKTDNGKVIFENTIVKGNSFTSKLYGMQMIFQDPYSSISGSFTVEEAVKEPLDINSIKNKEERVRLVKNVLRDVQLPQDNSFLERKCSTLSGGQRQRVAIARSLIMEPKVIIADEISSMLDPSTKAEILRLLKSLQVEKGFSMIYITHDLFIARKISNRVLVMKSGEIIEKGDTFTVFKEPKHEYTEMLLSNIM